MKKLIYLTMLIPLIALADKTSPTPTPTPERPTSQSSAVANANTTSSSDADSDSNASLTQNTKVERTAPAIFTSGTNNNVPCHGEWHAGASSPVGGLSFGKDRKDKDCLLKTAADDQYERGNTVAAARLYCKIKYYVDALGKECFELLSVPPPDTSVALEDDVATKDYVQATVKEAFTRATSK